MSVDANTPLGSVSQISGIVPEHRITNEEKNRNANKQRKKHPRSPKQTEDVEVEQSSPDSENKEDPGHSVDYLV